MKKALALLVLSLATLPSLANFQFLQLHARIGTGVPEVVVPNNGLITAEHVDDTKNYASVHSSDFPSNTLTIAAIPAGQQFDKWWFYFATGSESITTNDDWWGANGQQTNIVWTYQGTINPSDYIVHIVADFSYIDYTLKYNANGGSGSMTDQKSCYTNVFNLASNQFTKTGYTFSGWTNETITTALADQSSVSGAVFGVTYTNETATLYAQWTPNSYRVKFNKNADDAAGSMSDQPFTYDVAQNLSANDFSRDGYVFGGWTNATGTVYADQASVKNLASENGAEIELFAKWTQLWTIIFQDASQFGFRGFSTNTYENGQSISVPSNPSHDGYTFSGWTPSVSSTATADATYTASYSANHYFVAFHSNDGDDVVRNQEFEYGKQGTLALQSSLFSRTGYDFAGWALSAGSGEKAYDDGAAVMNLATAGTFDLYALWTPIEYTIAFDANGGYGTMAPMENIKYDTVTNLTKCGFKKQGVDFKCWTCAGRTFDDEAQVSNLTNLEGVVTMKAVWSEKCYVEFDANGGSGEMETQTFDAEDLPASLTSNAFEKVGYTFFGWATNVADAAALKKSYADGQTFETFASLPAAAGETATLYAVWQTNTYTVVFDPNCASYTGEMADQSFVYDQAQALTVNGFTNETGLAFAGWTTNQTGDVVFDDQATVSNLTAEADGTVTLHAVWDVGELSKAMDCDNLYWENQPNATNNTWLAKYEEGIGYGTDSCVVTNGAQISYMIAGVTTNGVLSFKWKANRTVSAADANDGLKVGYYTERNVSVTNFKDLGTLTRSEPDAWLTAEIEIKQSYFEGKAKIWLVLRSRRQSCFIDQMTWTPEGSTVEPTEEDKPTISAFMAAANGFTLSVDPSNISDSFSYQILATNELVVGDWPVKTNLTAEAVKAGFDIVPEAGEPTMFYKVKVIAK